MPNVCCMPNTKSVALKAMEHCNAAFNNALVTDNKNNT